MEICPECGKRHVVMWPDLDPFRRGSQFYCSHGCWKISLLRDMKTIKDIARKRRKGRLNLNTKITNDMRMKAAEMAINGESPLAYLRECGSKNPSASWQYIRSVLERKNPEIYAKLPDRLPKTAGEERQAETPETPTITIDAKKINLVETPEGEYVESVKLPVPPVQPEITKPDLNYRIRSVETDLGVYSADSEYFEFKSKRNKNDAIEMELDDFIRLAEELPKVMRILGVQL